MRRVGRFVMKAFLMSDISRGYYDLTGIPTADPRGFWDFVWPQAPGNGFSHDVACSVFRNKTVMMAISAHASTASKS